MAKFKSKKKRKAKSKGITPMDALFLASMASPGGTGGKLSSDSTYPGQSQEEKYAIITGGPHD